MRRARRGVVFVTTTDLSLDVMLRGQLRYLRENGLAPITVVARDTGRLSALAQREGVETRPLPLRREPSFLGDAAALAALIALLVRLRPRGIVYGTPKAALLAAIAASLARVPIRIHHLYGLRLDTAAGARFALLRACEQLTIRLSTFSIAVSPHLVARCGTLGLDTRRMRVVGGRLGRGSRPGTVRRAP